MRTPVASQTVWRVNTESIPRLEYASRPHSNTTTIKQHQILLITSKQYLKQEPNRQQTKEGRKKRKQNHLRLQVSDLSSPLISSSKATCLPKKTSPRTTTAVQTTTIASRATPRRSAPRSRRQRLVRWPSGLCTLSGTGIKPTLQAGP